MNSLKVYRNTYPSDDLGLRAGDSDLDYISLLKKVLETANDHDRALQAYFQSQGQIQALLGPGQVWVVTQYTIKSLSEMNLSESLIIESRLCRMNRFMVHRYFEIYQGLHLRMTILAQFVGLDYTSRQMVKMNPKAYIDAGFIDDRVDQRFTHLNKKPGGDINKSEYYPIKAENIDENNHVNNLVYLAWAEEITPIEVKDRAKIRTIDVKYGHELLNQDQVKIDYYESQTDIGWTSTYMIYSCDQDQLACQIQILWELRKG